jgi:hypothetical protein
VVAGLRDGFEGLSTVDVHRNARRKCAQGRALLQGSQRWGDVSR